LKAPVALLIFNRPVCTARVLDAIADARPPVLFVVGDGPRPDNPADERLVAEARAVIDRVDWPCEIVTCYSDFNLGCGRRVASGLDWVFANVGEAIVLEDDCVPHPTFFRYCEELLERYRDDERVHMIGGSNPLGERDSYSYHFSWSYPIWGWASWARAWKHYDYEMREWPRLRESDWLTDRLGDRRAVELARFWFDATHAGTIKQWDFQWTFSGWLRNSVAVTPSVNLVTNIGFGNDATHLHDVNDPFAGVEAQPIDFPLRHPPRVAVVDGTDRAVWDVLAASFEQGRRGGFQRRIVSHLTGAPGRLRALVSPPRLAGRERR
jgi:hypothetical protein